MGIKNKNMKLSMFIAARAEVDISSIGSSFFRVFVWSLNSMVEFRVFRGLDIRHFRHCFKILSPSPRQNMEWLCPRLEKGLKIFLWAKWQGTHFNVLKHVSQDKISCLLATFLCTQLTGTDNCINSAKIYFVLGFPKSLWTRSHSTIHLHRM